MRTHIIAHRINSDAVRARRTREDWCTYLELEPDTSWDDIEDAIIFEYMTGGDFVEFVTGIVRGFASLPSGMWES